jgi:hypothetical protein
MFKKILIANRGDNGRQDVAPDCLASAASGDRAAGADRV